MKNADLPDVPLVMDFATTDRQRQILKLVLTRQVIGRPFAGPPGIPEDRKHALRKAMEDTVKDPEFVVEATKRKLDVSPVSGENVEKLVAEVYQTPQEIVAEVRAAITPAN